MVLRRHGYRGSHGRFVGQRFVGQRFVRQRFVRQRLGVLQTPTPSANGTRGKQVVDATGGVWTFDGTKTLRNGVWMSDGNASEYLYVNSTVYAIASDGSLCKWNNGWSFAGTDIAA